VTPRRAAIAFALLMACAAAQNTAVLLGLAPPSIVMGGSFAALTPRLSALLVVALVVLATFALLILLRAGMIPGPRAHPVTRAATWVVAAYLLLNTLGNLAGTTWLERGMAGVTLLAAGCAAVVARGRGG
jgi:hypothetical protein